jgi:hypothetical protein
MIDQQLQQLVTLMQGDRQAVKRLVQASITRHPNKSANWHLDTVKQQLERDRL